MATWVVDALTACGVGQGLSEVKPKLGLALSRSAALVADDECSEETA
jgi:hypothetical protein